MVARVVTLVLLRSAAGAAPARAGHELPFYPGYYPQEIRIETLRAGRRGAACSRSGTLHAYVGADPFAGGRLPADVSPVESLGGYLVVTLQSGAAGGGDRESRCAAAARDRQEPGGPRAGLYVAHPYPVTPYHADYLAALRSGPVAQQAVRGRAGEAGAALRPGRAAGRAARRRRRPRTATGTRCSRRSTLDDLLARRRHLDGWLGPPWLKEGWFHAYLLQAPRHQRPGRPPGRRGALPAPRHRRLRRPGGARRSSSAGWSRGSRPGCERVVLGYTVRREPFNAEFSQGIENIAWDSQTGLQLRHLRPHRQAQGLPVERLAQGRRSRAAPPPRGIRSPASPTRPGGCCGPRVGDPGLHPGALRRRLRSRIARCPATVAVAGHVRASRSRRTRCCPSPAPALLRDGGEGQDRAGPRHLSPRGLGLPRRHAHDRRPTPLYAYVLRRALGRAARAGRARARSRGRGRHRDRAPGPRRRCGW